MKSHQPKNKYESLTGGMGDMGSMILTEKTTTTVYDTKTHASWHP